jgi:hypothetical protein
MTAFDWQRTRQRSLPQRAQPFPLADELLWSLSYPVNLLAIGMVPNPPPDPRGRIFVLHAFTKKDMPSLELSGRRQGTCACSAVASESKSSNFQGRGFLRPLPKFFSDERSQKIDDLCAERDWLKKEQPGHMKGRVLGGRSW